MNWKILHKVLSIFSDAYLDLCIYVGVRYDYWTNRALLWHTENLAALCELVPSTCRWSK